MCGSLFDKVTTENFFNQPMKPDFEYPLSFLYLAYSVDGSHFNITSCANRLQLNTWI